MLDLEGTGIPKQMSEELSVTKKRNRKHHNLFYKTKITSCSLLNICDIPPTLKKKIHKLESYPQCNGSPHDRISALIKKKKDPREAPQPSSTK